MTSEVPGSSQNSGTFTLLSDDEGSQNSVTILKVGLCWNRSIFDIFWNFPEFYFNKYKIIDRNQGDLNKN